MSQINIGSGTINPISITYWQSGAQSLAATKPKLNLGPDQILCANQSVDLDAGQGYSSYNWSTGGTTNTIIVSNPGTYSVTVTDANGQSYSDSINFTLLNAPTGAFSYAAPQFIDLSTDAQSWIWVFDDGQQSTQQHPTHVFATPGPHQVCLFVYNGCSKDYLCDTIIAPAPNQAADLHMEKKGLSWTPLKPKLDVSPVPATHGKVYFSFDPGIAERSETWLRTYDLSGQLIDQVKVDHLSKGSVRLDVQSYPQGIFLAVLQSAHVQLSTRFVIQ